MRLPDFNKSTFCSCCHPSLSFSIKKCKMMGPFLEEAATELKDKVRVAKMDSDQNPEWSGKLKVNGLPTIIVFDGKTGKELERVEGALMKDQLVQLGMKYA